MLGEFSRHIEVMEDKINATMGAETLQDMITLKSELLEVQQKFLRLRQVHKASFLCGIEQVMENLVKRLMNLETQAKRILDM